MANVTSIDSARRRRLAASIGGTALHAFGPSDEISARARKGLDAKFERLAREAHPELEGTALERKVALIRRLHFQRMALKSARVRQARTRKALPTPEVRDVGVVRFGTSRDATPKSETDHAASTKRTDPDVGVAVPESTGAANEGDDPEEEIVNIGTPLPGRSTANNSASGAKRDAAARGTDHGAAATGNPRDPAEEERLWIDIQAAMKKDEVMHGPLVPPA